MGLRTELKLEFPHKHLHPSEYTSFLTILSYMADREMFMWEASISQFDSVTCQFSIGVDFHAIDSVEKELNSISKHLKQDNLIILDRITTDSIGNIANLTEIILLADSIDLVELIMEFEREFELSIPDEKAEEIQTVGNAINFLEKAING